MKADAFDQAITILTGETPPRVWSVIVTIFGDLAQTEGTTIPGPLLGQILAHIGIKPEAMRVALHRLRQDTWIETRKQGRSAHYSLTEYGHKTSRDASARIYTRTHDTDEAWSLVMLPPGTIAEQSRRAIALQKRGFVNLGHGVFLGTTQGSERVEGALILQGALTNIPDWIGPHVMPKGLDTAFDELSETVEQARPILATSDRPSPIQTAALRALLVHRWRRLVLRSPNVPDILFGPNWSGSRCRTHVMELLETLPRPGIDELLSD